MSRNNNSQEHQGGIYITLYDVKSNTITMSQNGRMIQPEDNIVAANSFFMYNFYKISSILSVVALIISF